MKAQENDTAVSPWAAGTARAVTTGAGQLLSQKENREYSYKLLLTGDALVIETELPGKGHLLFMPAYSPQGQFELANVTEEEGGVTVSLKSAIGEFNVVISWPDSDFVAMRYITTLNPSNQLLFPFWPKDIIVPNTGKNLPDGDILVQQVGSRSGLLYATLKKPQGGGFVYLQNLTALADYCEKTETSVAESVTGRWPEMGFSLPPTKEKPLPANETVVISDAIVVFDPTLPTDEAAITRQFLDLVTAAYLIMPRPDLPYQNWLEILDKGLKDLIDKAGCWSQVKGKEYFNAYVSDYSTPPEIMVQLAVMLPLQDYADWKGADIDVIDTIRQGLPEFYNPDLKTIMRWLPAAEHKLEGEEPQKKPMVMDSWYLHHPLLNLSRLALKGDEVAKGLFFDSLDYAIKVARRFDYEWPVFYQMETLEVLKAETAAGKGGEKDVAGAYAHVMLQAYELTKDKQYLKEAEAAVQKLKGLGFELFYQANNTAFAAGALLRLFKHTGKEEYRDMSYVCIANIIRNCRLWDCNYGYGKHFPSFFTMFPLNDAPYTAAYEEQEVFCALHDYLFHAEGVAILPSVMLLCTEYIRYLIARAAYYYPPLLPKEMLVDEAKTGELAPDLWIVLEDLHDGWEKNGEVGQEVYGAGNAFGILPRNYVRVKNEDWLIHCDYPVYNMKQRGKHISLDIKGDARLTCRFCIIPCETKLPKVTLKHKGASEPEKGQQFEDGRVEYNLQGSQSIEISW